MANMKETVILRPLSADSPSASVVIPTLPSRDHDSVVESLRQQTIENFEVIVVNSAELDVCEARNAGILEADSDIILFTDDDCYAPETWVETARSRFKNDDIALLEGAVDVHRPGPRHYIGANLGVDRGAARQIGGFDPRFAGWRDDTEFGYRIESTFGLDSIQYDPDWEMLHPGEFGSRRKPLNEMRFKLLYPRRMHDLITTPNEPLKNVYVSARRQWYQICGRLYEQFLYSELSPL